MKLPITVVGILCFCFFSPLSFAHGSRSVAEMMKNIPQPGDPRYKPFSQKKLETVKDIREIKCIPDSQTLGMNIKGDGPLSQDEIAKNRFGFMSGCSFMVGFSRAFDTSIREHGGSVTLKEVTNRDETIFRESDKDYKLAMAVCINTKEIRNLANKSKAMTREIEDELLYCLDDMGELAGLKAASSYIKGRLN